MRYLKKIKNEKIKRVMNASKTVLNYYYYYNIHKKSSFFYFILKVNIKIYFFILFTIITNACFRIYVRVSVCEII
jgi:ABC-type lipoprotein release transport system permease subunit